MFSKETVYTILTRTIVAFANFFLVIFSSRIWGDEARGIIALIMADVSLITILNNISSGSTLTFHTSKTTKNTIFSFAIPAILFTSFVGATVFSIIQGFNHLFLLFILALLISYSTSVSLYYLGKNQIKRYNLFSLLPSVLTPLFLTFLFYILGITNIEVYFYAYYLSFGVVTGIGFYTLFKNDSFKINFDKRISKNIINYGVKNEINYFIQFMSSRVSYFFISSWLGYAYLGIFSVAVAISEAIWIISRSISAVHYSNIINTENPSLRIKMTEKAALNSLVFTLIAIMIIYFIPDFFFTFLFGDDFAGVKSLIAYLFPGVIAVAVSKVYVHYFSGIGKMRILIIKSSLGLITTIVLIFLLLRRFELAGACATLNIAYITSSIYLFVMFKREKRGILLQNSTKPF